MKKYLLLFFFIILCFPICISAETVEISCDKKEVKRDEEIVCQILANEMMFNTSSVSGKIVLDENLELVSSDYNKDIWKVLDSEFIVSDMNLIGENIIKENNYLIATFKVKAVNEETTISKIALKDTLIGDDQYENHSIVVDDYFIYTENEKIVNPSTSVDFPVFLLLLMFGIGVCGFCLIKRKRYI